MTNIRSELLICMALVLSVFVVYHPVTDYEFVNYDDDAYVFENDHVRAGLNLQGVLRSFSTTHACNWHPITWISHIFDNHLYGMNSGGHHFTNVLFHLLNTLLLFFVFNKATGRLWESSFVAALFALHPTHVESVAWVAERKDVLSTFFWMVTIWSYVWYAGSRSLKRYVIVLLSFALGLMSKPMVVTLPFVLLLMDYWPLKRFEVDPANPSIPQSHTPSIYLVCEKIPFIILSAVSGVVTYLVQQNCGAVNSLGEWPLYVRASNAFVAYIGYMVKMVWPFNLAVFYPHPEVIPIWRAAMACVLLLSISLFAIKKARRYPYFVVGWLWYLVVLVPVIGLVKVGAQAMADRYSYLPTIGLFIIIAWGFSDFSTGFRYKKAALNIAAILTLLILMMTARLQLGYWENSITLFEHAVKVTKDNDLAHFNLGNAFMTKGKIDEAIYHYNNAVNIRPDDAQTHTNLGIALFRKGDIDAAAAEYKKAIKIDPDSPEAHNCMGNILYAQGKFKKAEGLYEEALRIKSDYSQAHNNIGLALYAQGKIDKAIYHYTEALRIKPDYAETCNNLGAALTKKGMVDKAIIFFKEALRMEPDDVIAQKNLKVCQESLYGNKQSINETGKVR